MAGVLARRVDDLGRDGVAHAPNPLVPEKVLTMSPE